MCECGRDTYPAESDTEYSSAGDPLCEGCDQNADACDCEPV
jgi:hypothetical protein